MLSCKVKELPSKFVCNLRWLDRVWSDDTFQLWETGVLTTINNLTENQSLQLYKRGTFYRNRSCHSNVMTSSPILHITFYIIKAFVWKTLSGSLTWHTCLKVCKIVRISMRAFSRKFRVKFQGVKMQQKQNNFEILMLLKSMSRRLDEITFWS